MKKQKKEEIIQNHSQGQEKKFQEDDNIASIQLIDFLVVTRKFTKPSVRKMEGISIHLNFLLLFINTFDTYTQTI